MIYELTARAGEVKIIPTSELEEIAQNILTIIVTAAKEYEPRAQITNVIFDGELSEGKLNIRVQFKLVEKKLRGGVF